MKRSWAAIRPFGPVTNVWNAPAPSGIRPYVSRSCRLPGVNVRIEPAFAPRARERGDAGGDVREVLDADRAGVTQLVQQAARPLDVARDLALRAHDGEAALLVAEKGDACSGVTGHVASQDVRLGRSLHQRARRVYGRSRERRRAPASRRRCQLLVSCPVAAATRSETSVSQPLYPPSSGVVV